MGIAQRSVRWQRHVLLAVVEPRFGMANTVAVAILLPFEGEEQRVRTRFQRQPCCTRTEGFDSET